ncbi:MAG: hypothetical protein ACRCZF_27160, partial [Gemmataceae bacterium]
MLRSWLLAGVLATTTPITTLPGTAQAADTPSPPAASDAAKVELDKKILAEIQSHSEIFKNLSYLSDIIGPRLTGSPGLERANKWTESKMKEYGLENVRLEPWEVPVGWTRGHARLTLLEPTQKPLTVAAAGWTPSTKGKVSGDVVLMEIKSKADFEKYKGKLKNAVILRNAPRTVPSVMVDPSNSGRYAPTPRPTEAKKEEPKKDEPKKDEPKKEEPKR